MLSMHTLISSAFSRGFLQSMTGGRFGNAGSFFFSFKLESEGKEVLNLKNYIRISIEKENERSIKLISTHIHILVGG